METLRKIFNENRNNGKQGIYSICSAHPLVIEASLRQGLLDDSCVLIESTANQVNQFGGYTGMKPKGFVDFVSQIADRVGFPLDKLILGGDHLGPTCWVNESAELAMEKSKTLIKEYVEAGFRKIHLDTSMECSDDTFPLTDAIVAERAASLCKVAEQTAIEQFGQSDIVYIIGTEVPPPGGAKEQIVDLQVTPVINVQTTLDQHKKAFLALSLGNAWDRVIGLVVQPGVEFDNFSIIPYDPVKSDTLSAFITTVPNLVYEAHSTDYQPEQALTQLVQDHFAILKVGPALTFALREALYGLSHIENELFSIDSRSNLIDICELTMLKHPEYWNKFYPENIDTIKTYRHFSFSDRIRYYWAMKDVTEAVDKMLSNLSTVMIPMSLLSQFLPFQYDAALNKGLAVDPRELIIHKIMQVIQVYARACHSGLRDH